MAHRGASDLAPENSLAAFALAMEHGADLIETDVWFTADGEIVCHHDPTLARMTGDPRRLEHCSLRQVHALRLRDVHHRAEDERIPALAEVLECIPPTTALILELKDPSFRQPQRLARLLAVLGSRVEAGQVGIITDAFGLAREVKRRAPALVCGHIAMTDPWGNGLTELLGPWWPLLRLNPRYVRRAHARGQRVCPLDPNLHARLPHYLALGVDAVLTNDPRATRAKIAALTSPAA